MPISRIEYLRPVFESLDKLERPSDTELLIITDGDRELGRAVEKRIENLNYTRIRVINFGDAPAEKIENRRYRIAGIHNKLRHYIPNNCEYVMAWEDDTIIQPNSLIKLLDVFNMYEDCAFVEGVELGRHSTAYLGGWIADDIKNPQVITSVEPPYVGNPLKREYNEVVLPIDAGGLYCALIKADLYKQHNFKPYDTQGKNGLGCDVNLGLWLRNKGYTCFIDWHVRCDHIGIHGSVNLGNTIVKQVEFKKVNNLWEARTL